jgi:hypothetical protein
MDERLELELELESLTERLESAFVAWSSTPVPGGQTGEGE